jgi:serine/threonine protein kinase
MDSRAVTHPAVDVLSSYKSLELDGATAESVKRHLELCELCRQRLAGIPDRSGDESMTGARGATTDVTGGMNTMIEAQQTGELPLADGSGSSTLRSDSRGSAPNELVNHPQYEFVRQLGRGGVGVVYLARNKLMDRLEVLKVLHKETLVQPEAAERFLREIQSAAKLHHPNVVTAYSALQLGELMVFAMEYVEGDDLGKVIRAEGPLPVIDACNFAMQAAMGLQHAHERNMIHRDIKPGNLILLRQGKQATIKILDFGLAKITSEGSALTPQGQMLGTPDYMAPEQMLDAQKADIRVDIYSLGGTLYHFLAGKPPFRGESLYEILKAHHSVEARPLNLVRPEVPAALATVVAKMMAKDPAKRFQTPAEVIDALQPFLNPTGSNASPSVAEMPNPAAMQPSNVPSSVRGSMAADLPPVATKSLRWLWIGASVVAGILLLGFVVAWAAGRFQQ